MNVLVRTLCIWVFAARLAAAQSVPAEVSAKAHALEAELAKLGLKSDAPAKLEALGPGEYASACQSELERAFGGASWFELQFYLRQAMGIDAGKNPAETKVKLARATFGAFPVLYRSDAKSIAFDTSRLDGYAELEHDLARALVLAWRDQQRPLAQLLGEARTTESATLGLSLAIGEAELAWLGLGEARAQRDLAHVDASTLAPPLPKTFADEGARRMFDAGRSAMLARFRLEGWKSVASFYDEAPATTEQLLHPSKLYRDTAKKVALPEFPPELGLEIVRTDSIGELALGALLRETTLETTEAELASTGWDGDRIELFRTKEGELGLVWRLVFDRPEDVKQFAAAFSHKALGQPVVHGFAVDWVRCESVSISQRIVQLLAETKIGLTANPEDQESTAEIEISSKSALDVRPRLISRQWFHPRFELSIPAPEGWQMELVNNQAFLMGPQVGTFKDNLSLVALEGPRGVSIDELLKQQKTAIEAQPDLTFESSEKRTIDGREVGFLRYGGSAAKDELEFSVVIFNYGGRPVLVTATVARANWGFMKAVIDQSLSGIHFGVKPGHEGQR